MIILFGKNYNFTLCVHSFSFLCHFSSCSFEIYAERLFPADSHRTFYHWKISTIEFDVRHCTPLFQDIHPSKIMSYNKENFFLYFFISFVKKKELFMSSMTIERATFSCIKFDDLAEKKWRNFPMSLKMSMHATHDEEMFMHRMPSYLTKELFHFREKFYSSLCMCGNIKRTFYSGKKPATHQKFYLWFVDSMKSYLHNFQVYSFPHTSLWT